jgi:hypothetical protein
MSGVAAIRYLLANSAVLIAVVPASKIMAGTIPLNTELPAIGVQEISVTDRNTVDMASASVMHTSRVQVSVLSKTYTTQKSILELVRKACPNTNGTLNGVVVDSILPDSAGPDIFDADAVIYSQSRDFIVKYTVDRI